MAHSTIDELIQSQGLPADFIDTVTQWYQPLMNSIAKKKEDVPETPLVIGVQGSQGSGKSTLASFLKLLAKHDHGLTAVELSLDDFYLTHDERVALSKEIHPLFATRGVPGTHDVQLALDTIHALKSADASSKIKIPRFNKAIDDRFAESDWDECHGPVDIIIFEGWCVGCGPQTSDALSTPVNALEELEDSQGLWRTHVNDSLSDVYSPLFASLDYLAVLTAPSFECVYEWRWLQEQKLVEKWASDNPDAPARLLDEQSVKRFISHYERLTRHCLDTLPEKANWVMPLANDHSITDLIIK